MPLVRWQVPAEITDEVRSFAQKLVEDGEPVFVTVNPPIYTPPNLCFQNVELVVAVNGGQRQFGWYFHEDTDQLLYMAVFHAVWRTPDGSLVDVTPHPQHRDRILFLPDPVRVHRGKLIPNRYYPRVDAPVVQEMIRLFQKEVSYWNRFHDPKNPMSMRIPEPLFREIEGWNRRLRPRLDEFRRLRREEAQGRHRS